MVIDLYSRCGQGASLVQQGDHKPGTVKQTIKGGISLDKKSQPEMKVHKKSKKKRVNITLSDFIDFDELRTDYISTSNIKAKKEKIKTNIELKKKLLVNENGLGRNMLNLTCFNRFSVFESLDIDEEEKNKLNHREFEKNHGVRKKIKKTKRKRKQTNAKQKKKKLNIKSPEHLFTQTWSRCGICFISHTPHRKFCRWKLSRKKIKDHVKIETQCLTEKQTELISKRIAFLEQGKSSKASLVVQILGNEFLVRDNFWPYRLKGGAKTNQDEIANHISALQESNSVMVGKAIENAKYHNINLYHGVPNMADGNCAFESIIDNISTRACFNEKFDGTPDHWRFVWMSIIENIGFNNWHGNMSIERWKAEFEILKTSKTYEVELGDLVVPGIAHCTKKNILIFNTSELAHSPIYVVPASTFGGMANTDIPVCLAYNQVHYEGLVPCSEEDIDKTIHLTNKYLNGDYNIPMENVPIFKCETTAKNDEEFLTFDSKQTSKLSNINNSERNMKRPLSLEDLKKIPAKLRSKDQQKEIRRLMAKKKKRITVF